MKRVDMIDRLTTIGVWLTHIELGNKLDLAQLAQYNKLLETVILALESKK